MLLADHRLHAVREVIDLRVREARGVALLGGPACEHTQPVTNTPGTTKRLLADGSCVRTVVQVQVAVASLVQADLHKRVGGGLDAVLVAVVEDRVVIARSCARGDEQSQKSGRRGGKPELVTSGSELGGSHGGSGKERER